MGIVSLCYTPLFHKDGVRDIDHCLPRSGLGGAVEAEELLFLTGGRGSGRRGRGGVGGGMSFQRGDDESGFVGDLN